MLLLIVLSVLLLAVAIFALENGQAITVRFIYWELQSSVAVVTLAATAAGMLIAGLVFVCWTFGRAIWKRHLQVLSGLLALLVIWGIGRL